MADKKVDADRKVDLTTKITSAVAAMAAAFVARKLVTVIWTKATGKEPPTHPEDPQVALAEALSWALVTGITVEAARLPRDVRVEIECVAVVS